MTATLEHAQRLHARGLNVIPVPRPDACHDGKVPALPWRRWQTNRQTETDILAMFPRGGDDCNIAVITGAVSEVVVVDVDSPDAMRWAVLRLPYTPWQTQTKRGYHLWYRHSGTRIPNRARIETGDGRLALDLRADGGFVIAPGSVHASGFEYRYAGDWTEPRSRLPVFWPGWLARPRRPAAPVRTSSAPTDDIVTRARRYLAAIPPPTIGQGSDAATLYAACRLVRGFGLSAADAEAVLWEWAGGRAGWTREWVAQKVTHAERYGTEPIGALR